MSVPTILDRIIWDKKEQVQERQRRCSLQKMMDQLDEAPDLRGFAAALGRGIAQKQSTVIAEIKRASPSKGVICANFNPEKIARAYAQAGACCLSVLTEERYFKGADAYLLAARAACSLPVLRKDFIIDAYQILETRLLGADAILLIVAALSLAQLQEYHLYATSLGLDVLVEVHQQDELERALTLRPQMLGINNRNLHTFAVDVQTTVMLQKFVPDSVLLVSESGINRASDVHMLQQYGVYAYLVGESLMRTSDPGLALSALIQRVP